MRNERPVTLSAIDSDIMFSMVISLCGFRDDQKELTKEEKMKIWNFAKDKLKNKPEARYRR